MFLSHGAEMWILVLTILAEVERSALGAKGPSEGLARSIPPRLERGCQQSQMASDT